MISCGFVWCWLKKTLIFLITSSEPSTFSLESCAVLLFLWLTPMSLRKKIETHWNFTMKRKRYQLISLPIGIFFCLFAKTIWRKSGTCWSSITVEWHSLLNFDDRSSFFLRNRQTSIVQMFSLFRAHTFSANLALCMNTNGLDVWYDQMTLVKFNLFTIFLGVVVVVFFPSFENQLLLLTMYLSICNRNLSVGLFLWAHTDLFLECKSSNGI